MQKIIPVVVLKIIILSSVCGLLAALIWYFLSERVAIEYSSVLFWCGLVFIALAFIIFGGHSDVSLAPRDFGSAKAIDPKDMAYGKRLLELSEYAFLVVFLAGSLVVAISLFLTDWS